MGPWISGETFDKWIRWRDESRDREYLFRLSQVEVIEFERANEPQPLITLYFSSGARTKIYLTPDDYSKAMRVILQAISDQ
jgi:hypothetical protein